MSSIDPVSLIKPCRKIHGISAILLPFLADDSVDWSAFDTHVERTLDAGLAPAVNMDTGYGHLIDEATRAEVLNRTNSIANGRKFVAGAFVKDAAGASLDIDGYRKSMNQIESANGVPVIVQSYGLIEQGDDEIVGGDGNDKIFAGLGNDTVHGGAGNDLLVGGAGGDTLHGETGNDRIQGGDDGDTLHGDGGLDVIRGGNGHDTITGGTHDDRIWGNLGRDSLFGGNGNDVLRGGAWLDSMNGGAGNNDGCTLTDPGGLDEVRSQCETGVFGR